ncbi:MAG: CHAT domain-containing tetratricopeptide repeat protein [Pseudomonadota bacterium]
MTLPMFGCRIGSLVAATLLSASVWLGSACKTTEKAVSMDEAKNISLTFTGSAFTPPPRTIDDLEDVLKVDVGQAVCDNSPITIMSKEEVFAATAVGFCSTEEWCKAQKLFRRAEFLVSIGHFEEAITYIQMAIEEFPPYETQFMSKIALCHAYLGNFTAAQFSLSNRPSRNASNQSRKRTRRNYYAGLGALNQAEGNYRDAETALRQAIDISENAHELHPSERIYELLIERIDLAENLLLQGRVVEAEVEIRDVMNHPMARVPIRKARAALVLSRIYYEQGRYADAARVARTAVAAFIAAETHCSSYFLNMARQVEARSLAAMAQWDAALAVFEGIRSAMVVQPELYRLWFDGDPDWIMALMGAGRQADAGAMLAVALEKSIDLFGDEHYTSAEITGLYGVHALLSGDIPGAFSRYAAAAPALMGNAAQAGSESDALAARNRRKAFILEHYLDLLAQVQAGRVTGPAGVDAAEVSFRVAESIRGSSVQQAVKALSSRAAADNADLADLIRREQDADKQITALQGVLYNALSQASQDTTVVAGLRQRITDLKAARNAFSEEIAARFPAYADLAAPKPASVVQVRTVLTGEEAVVAFYAGVRQTFVWAFGRQGPVAFQAIDLGREALSARVAHLRKALDPGISALQDLPVFDLAAAHDLYALLFKPVAPQTTGAAILLVVPHGPLGRLPLGLLPTAPTAPTGDGAVFLSGYRGVPWLIRKQAVTVLPAAGVLATLRAMPPPQPGRRAFAGFGDPWFSDKQAAAAASPDPVHTRGLIRTRAIRVTESASLDDARLNSVTLEALQPLPDTREEVLGIAKILRADPSKDVFLGKAATESTFKGTDLSDRRVLVLATHGLVPGDLDGLTQPALALSSPRLAGDAANDGLLTMGEIMGLRLDADWVVLSACNTAAGAGEGSEAVSGLGQAFFYAGTRAVLVSNWPVESVSARLLTADLFARQAADPALSRAEALRRSMLDLLDNGVYTDPATGKPVFAYAHPIFWAPFSLVGEGGGTGKAR